MRGAAAAISVLAALTAVAAAAQEANGPPEPDEPVVVRSGDRDDGDARAIWVAGLAGGSVNRDDGPESPFGIASATVYRGNAYLRGAFTAYRGTLEQADTALPSTYHIASLGAGGNFSNWVVDAYASLGRQNYGKVETPAGKRDLNGASHSGYYSAGLRVGRLFEPAPGWYVTPTAEIQYVDTKSLRYRLATGEPEGFEIAEKAVTGNAAIRADWALGPQGQHYIGLSAAHYESDNGLTVLFLDPNAPNGIATSKTPDSWQELGTSATLELTRSIWLDAAASRTFGAVAGDSTSISLGVRLRL